MSAGSTLVSVVTVTVPVAGTLAAGYIVQRSERHSRQDERDAARQAAEQAETAARQAAEQAEAAARAEAQARTIATVMTTGLAWRRALTRAEVARRQHAHGSSTIRVNLDEVTDTQAEFGTAVFTALASTPAGPVYDALTTVERAYEEGFEFLRDIFETDATTSADSLRDLSVAVAKGMTALQDAARAAA